jgi:hypothetical protein
MGDGTTKVELLMLNAPEGAEQPASIHEGSCATLDADVKFTLETVKASKSTSTVKASLADLTNTKHAIVVVKSASDNTVISCANMPSAAVVSGGTMTMDQVMTQLLDQANELAGTIKKQEVDASQNAYDAWHATFAAHENDIKAKSVESQTRLEDAMHEVRDALAAGKWDEAGTAAQELIDTVKEVQTTLAGSSLDDAMQTLQDRTNDLIRETTNKDKPGSQAAYDAFHETFAANEDAIKAKSADAQAKIEDKMHEVRDAITAGDFEEAANAAKELLDAVKEADALVSGGTAAPSTGNTGNTGNTASPGAGLSDTMSSLATLANDLVRETTNKDADGSSVAYDEFHTAFAANEDAIKAKNASAQANIETAMHEVRDAIAVKDWTKAQAAANELVDTVREATEMVSGASGGDSLPTSGSGTMLFVVAILSMLALGVVSLGAAARRKAAR